MAVEHALHGNCTNHEPPNTITRLVRNIIMGCEFIMSHITHFYTLAALSYVQGPNVPPWTPYFDDSYYIDQLLNPGRTLPDLTKLNVPELSVSSSYTGLDGIWDNVVYEYVLALKHRREAHHCSAMLGGRVPQIQNGCLVGGCAEKPSGANVQKVKDVLAGTGTTTGVIWFLENRMIPLTHIVSYLYGDYGGSTAGDPRRAYDNDGTNPDSGNGSGSNGGGAQRVLAWGAFDLDDTGGDGDNRLLSRGCYEWNNGTSSMDQVDSPANLWGDLKEYLTNSRYDLDNGDTNRNTQARHPSSGYTNPNAATGYSWSKSPRIMDGATGKACQVGPLARMAVQGELDAGSGSTYYQNYKIGERKASKILDHVGIAPYIGANLSTVVGAYGTPPSYGGAPGFLCGFSTMDRHRARALEALKIAKAISGTGGWCDQLIAAAGDHYSDWSMPGPSSGTKVGYGAHEAPRGALAHFVEVTNGKISNYQCVVPTTWNVNPEAPTNTHGPIEDALIGITLSGVQTTSGGEDHTVPVEALRVVQGFDPCIACTVH